MSASGPTLAGRYHLGFFLNLFGVGGLSPDGSNHHTWLSSVSSPSDKWLNRFEMIVVWKAFEVNRFISLTPRLLSHHRLLSERFRCLSY